jgi:hypothetical protein
LGISNDSASLLYLPLVNEDNNFICGSSAVLEKMWDNLNLDTGNTSALQKKVEKRKKMQGCD